MFGNTNEEIKFCGKLNNIFQIIFFQNTFLKKLIVL